MGHPKRVAPIGIPFNGPGERLRVYGLFFFGLPAANALLDWPSWAISRGLTKDLVNASVTWPRLLGHGLLDVAFAGLCLVGLAAVMPVIIALSNIPNLDVDGVIDQVAAEPGGRGLWITIMLLSTLLPTLGHILALFASAITSSLPRSARERHARNLAKGSRSKTTSQGSESDDATRNNGPTDRELGDAATFLTLRWVYALAALAAVVAVLGIPVWFGYLPIAQSLADVARGSLALVRGW